MCVCVYIYIYIYIYIYNVQEIKDKGLDFLGWQNIFYRIPELK